MITFRETEVRILFSRLNMLEAALRDFGNPTLAGQVVTARLEFFGSDGYEFPPDRISVLKNKPE